jgi:MFS family permease
MVPVVATAQTEIASMFGRLDIQSYIGTCRSASVYLSQPDYIFPAYVLTSTVFLPVFASIADIFGRYWAMQIGVICFMVGSAISTGANSMPVLLIGRGVAGIGAAALLTVRRFSMELRQH